MCRLPFDVSVWHIAWYTVTNTKTLKCLVHRITQHETFGRWCLLNIYIQIQHTNFYVPGNLASLNIYCNTHTGQSIHVSVQSWAGATTLCACVCACVWVLGTNRWWCCVRSVSDVQLEPRPDSKASLGVDTNVGPTSMVRTLTWTPPLSVEGSTPTWTEGTPSFTESSSSGDLGMLAPASSASLLSLPYNLSSSSFPHTFLGWLPGLKKMQNIDLFLFILHEKIYLAQLFVVLN